MEDVFDEVLMVFLEFVLLEFIVLEEMVDVMEIVFVVFNYTYVV